MGLSVNQNPKNFLCNLPRTISLNFFVAFPATLTASHANIPASLTSTFSITSRFFLTFSRFLLFMRRCLESYQVIVGKGVPCAWHRRFTFVPFMAFITET